MDNAGAEHLPGWRDAGIRVAASRDVEIYGNVLIGNTNAIMLIQQQRNDSPSKYGPHELDNIIIHDNDITMTDNLTVWSTTPAIKVFIAATSGLATIRIGWQTRTADILRGRVTT
jgi:hypothetical protein